MSKRPDRLSCLLLYAAVALLLAGLGVGGYTGWDWWSRVEAVHNAQAGLTRSLDERWSAGLETAAPSAGLRRQQGSALPFGGSDPVESDPVEAGAVDAMPIARLHVPSLDLRLVVVEGVSDADLRHGPGRIPGTQELGAPGNAGIAGHRYPGVFWDLDELAVGAPIVVETREAWLVYRVIEARVVGPGQSEVLAPPPPGTGPLLTLVTCEPKLSTARRLIRQATLVRRDPHTGPRPAELG